MKIANDIRAIIEDDVKRLTEAFLTGEISLGTVPDLRTEQGGVVESGLSPSQAQAFASNIIRFQLESRTLSLIIPYLSTMKWLSLDEACIYARKSRNTILDLIKEGKIYSTKAEGGGWIVDRETIDAHYNEERLALQEKLRDLKRRAS